jgi:hypothetical protein
LAYSHVISFFSGGVMLYEFAGGAAAVAAGQGDQLA